MRRTALLTALFLLPLLQAPPTWAGPLEDAKVTGEIGERYDGYLGVRRDDAPASVRTLVKDINAKRKAEYAEVAKRNGIDVEEVGVIAGRKLVRRAEPGEWVMSPKGKWVQVK